MPWKSQPGIDRPRSTEIFKKKLFPRWNLVIQLRSHHQPIITIHKQWRLYWSCKCVRWTYIWTNVKLFSFVFVVVLVVSFFPIRIRSSRCVCRMCIQWEIFFSSDKFVSQENKPSIQRINMSLSIWSNLFWKKRFVILALLLLYLIYLYSFVNKQSIR